MSEVTLIDYGLGNIRAFANIYERLNISFNIGSTSDAIRDAKRLILPGVGAFDWAMKRLNQSGLRSALDAMVLERETPVLGVCVGMQMMALSSDEGTEAGLGWFDAVVTSFDQDASEDTPLPHMGWNDVTPLSADSLFRNIESPRYYFLHSYCVVPADERDKLATANYAGTFTAAIRKGGIFGTQFHPEKSHGWGIDLLQNFARI